MAIFLNIATFLLTIGEGGLSSPISACVVYGCSLRYYLLLNMNLKRKCLSNKEKNFYNNFLLESDCQGNNGDRRRGSSNLLSFSRLLPFTDTCKLRWTCIVRLTIMDVLG